MTVAGAVLELERREVGMVLERRRPVARGVGLSDPQLHAVQHTSIPAGRLLGVRDTVAGGHQVQLAGPDHLLRTEAVAVEDLTVEQPRHRLQPDVGMRSDVDAVLLGDQRRSHVIEEAPRADTSPRPSRQRPAHLQLADQCLVAGHELDARMVLGRRGPRSSGASTGVTGPLTTPAPRPIASSAC